MDKIFFADRSLFSSSDNFIQYIFKKYYAVEDINIFRQESGKPYVSGTKKAFFISVSHTDCYIFLAVSNQNIGIDAERIDRKINMKPLLKKFPFLFPDPSSKSFLKEWVLMESAAKYLDIPLYSVLKHKLTYQDNEKIKYDQQEFYFSRHEIIGHFFAVAKKEKSQTEFIPITTLF